MPDFQFSEENPVAASPSDSPTKSSENSAPAPAKSSGFQLLSDASPAPETPAPITPAPATPAPIAGPPLPKLQPPASPVAAPRSPVPAPPQPTAPASAPTIIAPAIPVPAPPKPVAPTAVPAPAVPMAPTQAASSVVVPGAAATPVTPASIAPAPTTPNLAPPKPAASNSATPSVAPHQAPQIPQSLTPPANAPAPSATPNAAPGTANPNAAPRQAPVPIALTLPVPTTTRPLDTIADEIEAPQDDFSRKIWEVGQKIKVGLDALEGPASWLLRVAAVVGVCALAYILAATLIGGAGTTGKSNMAELTRNLDLASKAFVFSLLGAAAATLLLGYEDNRLGAIVCALGVIFHFAMPIALKKFAGDTPAISVMAIHFRQGGYFLVMIGVVKAICDTAIWLWNLPERMKQMHANVGVSNQAETKQRIIARQANMLSPCWKLPFCRESIRKQCPAFLAKKTCWKFGRGCYCDTEMISRIVRGESLDFIKAPTQQSRQGKPPCGRCYIYLEHQTYKFRVLSPLALPVAVLSTWLVWPLYTRFFAIGDKVFNSLWSSLSFNTASLATGDMKSSQEALDKVAALGNNTEDIARIAQNMFGILLGFMVLIYISKFIEWAIYKAKW